MKGFIIGAATVLGLVGLCHLHKKGRLPSLKVKGTVACTNLEKKTFYVHSALEKNISMRFFVTPETKIMFLETTEDDNTARFKDIIEGAKVAVSFLREKATGKMIADKVVITNTAE